MVYETLKRGDYARGLEMFENRQTRLNSKLRGLAPPEWRGQDLTGKRILVQGEQGLGDEIQMARFLPRLRELGASAVYLLCNAPNIRLLGQLDIDYVAPRAGVVTLPDYDYWVAALSLPYLLGVRLETLSGAPYLPRPAAEPGRRVGLAWNGSPNNPTDATRSMPSAAVLDPIPDGLVLEPSGDMLDSARQLAGLRALVTVCTSWAHLAGAMGLPTYVILSHDADWRWGLADRTPWYSSVRLFRQDAPGEWGAPVERAAAVLRHGPLK